MTFCKQVGLLGLVCWVTASAYAQQTIYVNGTSGNNTWDGLCETWDGGTCGPRATIQAGIDAAGPGDTVLVAPGTYLGAGNKNLDPGGKAVTLRSVSGAEETLIDCEADGRGFYLHSGETLDTVIDGFTIQNGAPTEDSPGGEDGGGIYCDESSVTVANSIVRSNAASVVRHAGGGIYCRGGDLTVTASTIANNSAGYGAGVYSQNGELTATSCTITDNNACLFDFGHGGGIYCENGTIRDCTITRNCAGGEIGEGGGILCSLPTGAVTIVNCSITDNRANGMVGAAWGGGVWSTGNITIVACVVARNRASAEMAEGGGMYCKGQVTITNCCLLENVVRPSGLEAFGGGMRVTAGHTTIANCTISNNNAGGRGDATSVYNAGLTIRNSIIWGHVGSDQPQDVEFTSISYCDIEGGVDSGVGNIDADPRFVRNSSDGGDGWWDDPSTPDVDEGANNDYGDLHLLPDSPCIDAGDNAGIDSDYDSDLDGHPRRVDDPNTPDTGSGTPPIVDLGSYEWPDQPDCNGNGNPDGWDVTGGSSADCNENGVPDECEPDCNENGVTDACDIADGTSQDCNANEVPDECDLADGNAVDCNENDVPDECDLADGAAADCNNNGVPDECDIADGAAVDCNENGSPDECDLADGTSQDCNANEVPDECDLADGAAADCNENGILDECDLTAGTAADCNENGILDECDLTAGTAVDCNRNGVPDGCDLVAGTSADCNENEVPDECDLAEGGATDCNNDGVPDECNIADGTSADSNGNALPDECEAPDIPQPSSWCCSAPALSVLIAMFSVTRRRRQKALEERES